MLTNRSNRIRYRVYEPVYDWVAKPLNPGRRRAIERLDPSGDDRILLLGCGTGIDLEYLPGGANVVAADLLPAMVDRTMRRGRQSDQAVHSLIGDAHQLPFEADSFDAVLLHLILSVVPDPTAVVAETERVLRDDGTVSIFDKFSPPDSEPSIVRRLANPAARALFADLNRDLEPMVAGTSLAVGSREPFLGGLYTVTTAEPAGESG